jgi:hypothetical protein
MSHVGDDMISIRPVITVVITVEPNLNIYARIKLRVKPPSFFSALQ